MTVELHYRIDSEVKEDFSEFIEEKYGQKKKKCGSELSKWMKLCLTIEGNDKYSDDPDVQELLEAAKKTPCTHTHHHYDDEDKDLDSNLDDEEYLDAKFFKAVDKRFDEFERNMKKAIAINIDKKVSQKVKEELEGTYNYSSVKKPAPMELFMSSFIEEYGEWTQVSYNELSHLAVQVHGVSDKRSIKNRINYLVGKGVITEFSPNVYNVLH